jgi:hypothetical protein
MTDTQITERHGTLLRLHRDLDLRSRCDCEALFISGWNCANPFANEYLDIPREGSPSLHERYHFMSDDAELLGLIHKFHELRDGAHVPDHAIFPASGSSLLILSQFLSLIARGVTTLYYIPPLYYSFYYYASVLRLRLQPVCAQALCHEGQRLELPTCRAAYLALADPIWMMGRSVLPRYIADLRDWQQSTGGFLLVDGTFQYLSWNAPSRERSADFQGEQMMRLVCPTKTMALHSTRFAYLLVPTEWREEIRYAASNAGGPCSYNDLLIARRIMRILCSRESNSALISHIRSRYASLVGNQNFVSAVGSPDSGYYVFGRYRDPKGRRVLTMDERYFDLSGYPDCVRVNLLCRLLFD